MTDPDVEDLLRRYRPAGPSLDLRGRVLSDMTAVGRTWPWVAAAAVLLAATLSLHVSTTHLGRSVDIVRASDSRWDAITDLAELAGGSAEAIDLAEAAIALDTIRSEPSNEVMEVFGPERLR